jgi:hypothetical protein
LLARLDAILVGVIQASARNASIGNLRFSEVAPQGRDDHARLLNSRGNEKFATPGSDSKRLKGFRIKGAHQKV